MKEEQNETLETGENGTEQTGFGISKKELIEDLIYVVVVVLLAVLIHTYVGERTTVDGSSMYDTLEDGDSLWLDKLSYRFKDPERFDIVVFPMPENEFYIKRIIGMPGETIRIDESGTIYVNDEPLEENYGYETIEESEIGRAGSGVTLKDDEYFVMGDNRNNSMDSRTYEVGNISRDRLRGKAVFRMWPFSKIGRLKK